MSLEGRTFTFIRPRVQLVLGDLTGQAIYGLVTEIPLTTNRTLNVNYLGRSRQLSWPLVAGV
jgi:hypothetical protein